MSALPPIATAKANFPADGHVRFTPKSRHVQRKQRCPLWAKSGHWPPQWSQTQLLQHGLRQSAHKDHGRIGLDRLTEILPSAALSIEDYRAIPKLLSDKVTAKFLQHRKTIDSVMIAGLFALPSALRRPAIFKLFDRCQRMDRFAHGLRFLGERTGLSFDGLVNELSALDQTEQVIARITEIVESLPLPELPPLVVGSLYRVDRATEIRSLAKTWHNCLADYLFNINEGTAAVYRSCNGEPPAVAFVSRFDRIGWLLNQIKGPDNVDLEQSRVVSHQTDFLNAGIPDYIDVMAIKEVILEGRFPRLRN